MFWIGFARYFVTVADEPDVPPVIVSLVISFCCELIYRTELRESSTRIVAVAFDVAPVIVSPSVNLPVKDSSTNRSPSSSKTYADVVVSNLT